MKIDLSKIRQDPNLSGWQNAPERMRKIREAVHSLMKQHPEFVRSTPKKSKIFIGKRDYIEMQAQSYNFVVVRHRPLSSAAVKWKRARIVIGINYIDELELQDDMLVINGDTAFKFY